MTEVLALQVAAYVAGTVVSAAFAAGGAYFAVKTRVGYVEKGIDEIKADLRELRAETSDEFKNVHARINRTNDRIRQTNGKGATS